MRNHHTMLLALAAAALHTACGKRGDPLPPLRRTPQPIMELSLAQRGRELEVRVQAPRTTTEGERLGVVTVELMRAFGAAEFHKAAVRRQLKAAPGERLVVSEELPAAGTVVRVAALAISNKRDSVLSPIRLMIVAEPVPAPDGLAASVEPDGVRLRFTPPQPLPPWIQPSPSPSPVTSQPSPEPSLSLVRPGAPAPTPEPTPPPAPEPTPAASPSQEPAPPATAGFYLYRRAENGGYGAPLVTEPLRGEASFLDATAPMGARVCYAARTVVSGAPLIESEESNESCVRVEDKKAPAAPLGVAALTTDTGVEVSWSPSPEPDLALYRVYRQTPGGAPESIAEVRPPETSILDTDAASGRFVYFVSAVDAAGNESPRSAHVEGGRQ